MKCFGSNVRLVSKVKYLGVYLDETLNGSEQANVVIKKSSSRLAFLYRKAPLLDRKCRGLLCMALIQPFIDYCSSSWYSGLSAQLKGSLDVLQRKMIRFVLGLDSRSHVDTSHLARIGWLNVKDRVRYFKLIHAFKIYRGSAPAYISESFKNFSSYHSYNTRGSQTNFLVSKNDSSHSIMLSSFSYTTKREWNNLPSGLKGIISLQLFKSKLREFFLKAY